MIKNISSARKDYKKTYSKIRRFGERLYHDNIFKNWNDAENCALESYDNHDSQFTGWTSRLRRARFIYRKIHVLPHAEFPF